MSINSVVIIGSGNVATCMGKALKQAGVIIAGIYSPNYYHAQVLAEKLDTVVLSALSNLPTADFYLLAVKDEAIQQVSSQLNVNGLVVHTSGNTPVSVLNKHKRHGIFYALQTFNSAIQPDFTSIPFLLETSLKEDEPILTELAHKLSKNVRYASTIQRQNLHLAAVFANNFTNHLLVIAQQILQENNLSFDLLKPLIVETINNALADNPANVQTGPAIRHDNITIQNHLSLIQAHPAMKEIYWLITESIQQFHSKKH